MHARTLADGVLPARVIGMAGSSCLLQALSDGRMQWRGSVCVCFQLFEIGISPYDDSIAVCGVKTLKVGRPPICCCPALDAPMRDGSERRVCAGLRCCTHDGAAGDQVHRAAGVYAKHSTAQAYSLERGRPTVALTAAHVSRAQHRPQCATKATVRCRRVDSLIECTALPDDAVAGLL